MDFKIFTLHPRLFDSFVGESLVARAIAQSIISIQPINWRDQYGAGNYKKVDERPYGGGTGMVIQPDQIYQAMRDYDSISPLFVSPAYPTEHSRKYPRNNDYYNYWQSQKNGNVNPRSITISMTPRGYQFNQKTAEWLSSEFDTISILAGRYEGFDSRVSELVDLELSMGPYVTNGGEIPAMVFIEAVARLLPNFVSKNPSVMHDSFSSSLNQYEEMSEYVQGTRRIQQIIKTGDPHQKLKGMLNNASAGVDSENLFDAESYMETIAPFIEHPQYTRPSNWMNFTVPEVLIQGNHKAIQKWRESV